MQYAKWRRVLWENLELLRVLGWDRDRLGLVRVELTEVTFGKDFRK